MSEVLSYLFIVFVCRVVGINGHFSISCNALEREREGTKRGGHDHTRNCFYIVSCAGTYASHNIFIFPIVFAMILVWHRLGICTGIACIESLADRKS